MILHVRDASTDALVRELARRKGVSLTEAVREAVELALAHEDRRASLWEKTADIRAEIDAQAPTGLVADKQFFDEI